MNSIQQMYDLLDILWWKIVKVATDEWCGGEGHISKATVLAIIEDAQEALKREDATNS